MTRRCQGSGLKTHWKQPHLTSACCKIFLWICTRLRSIWSVLDKTIWDAKPFGGLKRRAFFM
eukprot:CAMPEP_0170332036 /NCGR_PEP_ID=MMETSP0116_2-20130129/67006_1 /TAXON_ID=400756 /ORGANISM="Durinskia baltica, Strain CSIRO CS-38" /LENGTH=61 /DNA_ID=CAMNT_0010585315 /DNA_START=100 /DNA_END=285 /DNA_ORIENTATION=+